MPTKPIAAAAALLFAIVPAGYAAAKPNGQPYMGGPDNFGEANRQTYAAQIVDPDPVYTTIDPETHAEHAAQAIERYRQDKVKKPERQRTSSTNSGNGSGGSGGSGSSGGGN